MKSRIQENNSIKSDSLHKEDVMNLADNISKADETSLAGNISFAGDISTKDQISLPMDMGLADSISPYHTLKINNKKILNTRNITDTKSIINSRNIRNFVITTADENSSAKSTDFIHGEISNAGLDNLLKFLRKDYPNGSFQAMLLLLILLFSGITMWLIKSPPVETSTFNSDMQVGIAEDIIRFHVIANSDSKEDQALKLIVKDTLVSNLSPYLRDANTLLEARAILTDQLTNIEELAEATILANGYCYPVTVSLGDSYFPLKVYGDYSFPPGTYEALRVQIGAAKGQNWWCVMFPPLCFVDETYSIVDESSKEKLKYLLTEAEYDSIVSQKTPIKIKFKLFEAIKDFFHS